ncbi:MAG: class I SAM-dependent methyltransferase [Anaerolineae bacterium]
MPRSYSNWFDRSYAAAAQPSDYHERSRERYCRTLAFAEASVRLNPCMTVAEIGPGWLLPMVSVGVGCRTTAYGLVDDPALKAALNTFGIEHIRWDLQEPLETEKAQEHDLVFFLDVIEHICRWPVELLSDMARLIRPGGYLVLTTVNLLRLSNRARILAGRSPFINPFVRTPDGRNHVREYTMSELCDYLVRAGLEVRGAEFWGLHNERSPLPVRIVERIAPSVRNYLAIVARKPGEHPPLVGEAGPSER